jgi:hypothetical protein
MDALGLSHVSVMDGLGNHQHFFFKKNYLFIYFLFGLGNPLRMKSFVLD